MSLEDQKNGSTKKSMTGEVRQYVEKRLELFSLTIAEQVSRILAESFQKLLGLFILSFAIFFFWFAIGFWVGELVGSISAGFAISAVPLFLVGFFLLKKTSRRITEKVQSELISKVIDEFDSDQEQEKIEEKTFEQK